MGDASKWKGEAFEAYTSPFGGFRRENDDQWVNSGVFSDEPTFWYAIEDWTVLLRPPKSSAYTCEIEDVFAIRIAAMPALKEKASSITMCRFPLDFLRFLVPGIGACSDSDEQKQLQNQTSSAWSENLYWLPGLFFWLLTCCWVPCSGLIRPTTHSPPFLQCWEQPWTGHNLATQWHVKTHPWTVGNTSSCAWPNYIDLKMTLPEKKDNWCAYTGGRQKKCPVLVCCVLRVFCATYIADIAE